MSLCTDSFLIFRHNAYAITHISQSIFKTFMNNHDFNPKIHANVLLGWDDEAYEVPLPQSDGYAHG